MPLLLKTAIHQSKCLSPPPLLVGSLFPRLSSHHRRLVDFTLTHFPLFLRPGFERHVPGYPRYQYTGDPEVGEHNLVIKGVTLTEDGEYQCQVGPTNDNPPIWAAANVTVLREYRGREDMLPLEVGIVGRKRWRGGSLW